MEESDGEKTIVSINVKDIEQLVFNSRQELMQAKAAYKEEDSYLNPSQTSFNTDDELENQRIQSFN